jgi:hypothetical protein
VAFVRIHDGFFSMGVSALRASTRSMRRPSGAMVTQAPSSAVVVAGHGGGPPTSVGALAG